MGIQDTNKTERKYISGWKSIQGANLYDHTTGGTELYGVSVAKYQIYWPDQREKSRKNIEIERFHGIECRFVFANQD